MKTRGKRGQAALEFMLYIGLSIAIFASIALAATLHTQSVQNAQISSATQDLSASIRFQLTYLASMPEGTSLQLTMPERLANKYRYTIDTYTNYVLLTVNDIEYVVATPPLTGTLQTGANTLTKTNTAVSIS